jgi:hypothetical protein
LAHNGEVGSDVAIENRFDAPTFNPTVGAIRQLRSRHMDVSDFDTNNDGIQDLHGYDTNNDSLIDTWVVDNNQDGILDATARDADEDGVVDLVVIDANEDGQADSWAGDLDASTTEDWSMSGSGVTTPATGAGLGSPDAALVPAPQTGPADIDGDGIPNAQDSRDQVNDTADYDGDLVPDSYDRDKYDPTIS